jgi:hypothetical protein
VLQGHSTGCQKITYYQARKRDKRILGLILLAPSDDLNLARKGLGKNYGKAVLMAERLIRTKHGDEFMPSRIGQGLVSANRFASFAIKGNAEADLFDYETGSFKLLKRIRIPIFATFGSAEEHRTNVSPARALAMIKEKATASQKVDTALIKGADHGFSGKEKELADAVARWIEKV